MGSWVGAIEQFNPYVAQIPTEAYTKVGMFKEEEYKAGVIKTQNEVDNLAGLDIANEGGRQYLRSRISELTNTLNKYSGVDFSDPNNVSQLRSLAKPLYQDENIFTDVTNTGVYRKWQKEASEAFKSGKMDLGNYARESADASKWLNSDAAGAKYTGRAAPNLATKKDLVDRIIKAKKDGFEKNEYVLDYGYDKDRPYYVQSTKKYYSEADFNNFVTDSIMSSQDRETLQNEHWYENQGVPSEALQLQDINMYQGKIRANEHRIAEIREQSKMFKGDKKVEAENTVQGLIDYNKQLSDGKIKFLKELNLADPTSRDVFHRDIAESRFVNSLKILQEQVDKQEYKKQEAWFLEKQMEIELAKEAAKTRAAGAGKTAKGKSIEEQIAEVGVYTPASGDAVKTNVSLNTIQRGWQFNNDNINQSMNNLIGTLQKNNIDVEQFLAKDASGRPIYDQVQVASKAGASMSIPKFKDQAAKNSFYKLVSGLNFAYTKEAEDGHIDNKSLKDWIKTNVIGYKDDDPNSKFSLNDKTVSDALNTIKGTTALIPKLDQLFSDKNAVRALAQIDKALLDKKKFANDYREALLKSNSLSAKEMATVRNSSDEDLLDQNYILDKEKEKLRYKTDSITYKVEKDKDGSYSIIQDIYEPDSSVFGGLSNLGSKSNANSGKKLKNSVVLSKGFNSETEANGALNTGVLSHINGITPEAIKKAEKYVTENYSYIQEQFNTSAQNLKENEPAYKAFQASLNTFMNKSLVQATSDDLKVQGLSDVSTLTGIKDIDVQTFSVGNTEDIFNPNPVVNVTFTATNLIDDGTKKDPKPASYNATVSLRSFLATNPNYRTVEYAKYFGPVLYAREDASARIHAAVNPLEGSNASYNTRDDVEVVNSRTNQQGNNEFVYDDYQDSKGSSGSSNQYQWETLPVEKDGQQTMVSYKVFSLGQEGGGGLGSTRKAKTGDKNYYEKGAFYVKLKVPTSDGKPKEIIFKAPNGEAKAFNNASDAYYTINELLFKNPDLKFDEVDPKTNQPNYFTTNTETFRGIFNTQLILNGYPTLDVNKINAAVSEQEKKKAMEEALKNSNSAFVK